MYILDSLPKHIQDRMSDSLLLVASTDVDEQGKFTAQWLILTSSNISIVKQNGDVIKDLPIGKVEGARIVLFYWLWQPYY